MSEKRRGLGRGLGALIPGSPESENGGRRPVDVFFRDNFAVPPAEHSGTNGHVSREAPAPAQAPVRVDPTPASSTAPAERVEDNPATVDAQVEAYAGPVVARQAPTAASHRATSWPPDSGDTGVVTDVGEAPEPSDHDGATGQQGLDPVPGARFAELPVGSIRPNPRQPRTVIDDDEMVELVHSIREIGVLQPIVVRPVPPGERVGGRDSADDGPTADEPRYELIMGERRWRATQAAGLELVPAIIKETHDDDLLRDALLENLHRSQLNALDEAAAYQQLLDDFGCTHDELACRIGRSRPQISNTLRLLRLPPLVARRVAAGVLSAGHARALLGLVDGAAMERLAQRIVAEGLSVRSVEEIVTLGGDDAPTAGRRRRRAGDRHPQLDDLAAQLSDRFDTRVSIALGQRKGKLTVEFASVDDLNRIVELLGHPVPSA